ncbi:MAG: hypothetical protein MZU91_07660 [Desulfosudis oleivorans]|nr:hypothetical protein [Desulfosudis oleivorans]
MTYAEPAPSAGLERLFDEAVDRHGLHRARGCRSRRRLRQAGLDRAAAPAARARGRRLAAAARGRPPRPSGCATESTGDEALRSEQLAGELGPRASHGQRADVQRPGRRAAWLDLDRGGRPGGALRIFRATVRAANGYREGRAGPSRGRQRRDAAAPPAARQRPAGLGGIPAVRGGMFIRPLLQAFRSGHRGLPARPGDSVRELTDASNADRCLRRNRIRHRADPAPGAGLSSPAARRRAQPHRRGAGRGRGLDRRTCSQPVVGAPAAAGRPGPGGAGRAGLAALPLAAARRVVRAALGRVQRRPAAHRLRPCRGRSSSWPRGRAAPARAGVASCAAPRGRSSSSGSPPAARLPPDAPGTGLRLPPRRVRHARHRRRPAMAIRIRSARRRGLRAAFGTEPVHGPPRRGGGVDFRSRSATAGPGTASAPLGAGGSQTLKKFFGDHKVALPSGSSCPVIVSDGRIVWVAGHRLDERARVTAATRRVITAERLVAPEPPR